MGRRSEKFIYRCTNQNCREECTFNEMQPANVRIGCPACLQPLEFVRPPLLDEKNLPPNPTKLSPNEQFVDDAVQEKHDRFTKPANSDGTLATIQEREATHGSFYEGSFVAQELKLTIHHYPTWHSLSSVQREALDQICSKISRIVVGNANTPDHWLDISGYALLAKDALTENED